MPAVSKYQYEKIMLDLTSNIVAKTYAATMISQHVVDNTTLIDDAINLSVQTLAMLGYEITD